MKPTPGRVVRGAVRRLEDHAARSAAAAQTMARNSRAAISGATGFTWNPPIP